MINQCPPMNWLKHCILVLYGKYSALGGVLWQIQHSAMPCAWQIQHLATPRAWQIQHLAMPRAWQIQHLAMPRAVFATQSHPSCCIFRTALAASALTDT